MKIFRIFVTHSHKPSVAVTHTHIKAKRMVRCSVFITHHSKRLKHCTTRIKTTKRALYATVGIMAREREKSGGGWRSAGL